MATTVLTSTQTKNVSDTDINKTVERAIDLLDFDFSDKIETVIIKPNLCYYWDYSTGETTDPRVVSAAIDYVRDHASKDVEILIAEADASAMKTKYSFKVLGYEKLSRTKNVKLVNLCDTELHYTKVKVQDKDFELPISKLLLNPALIINIPKLKTHNVVGVTCALKNMFGAIAKPRKYAYHKMLSDVIVGVNKIIRSDITLVDGIIARGSHPKKLGVLLAGDNPLATDFIAAKLMGFNPKRIHYLNLAQKEKIGDFNNIRFVEDQIELREVKTAFPSENFLVHKLSWSMQLKMLKIYVTLVDDVVPPVLN